MAKTAAVPVAGAAGDADDDADFGARARVGSAAPPDPSARHRLVAGERTRGGELGAPRRVEQPGPPRTDLPIQPARHDEQLVGPAPIEMRGDVGLRIAGSGCGAVGRAAEGELLVVAEEQPAVDEGDHATLDRHRHATAVREPGQGLASAQHAGERRDPIRV